MQRKLALCVVLGLSQCVWPLATIAQPAAKTYQVGVVLAGGPYHQTLEGLRDGLKELGLVDGKQVILHVYDTKGDPRAAEAAAASLEQKKVDLIYSLPSSVSIAVKRATKTSPIVFYAGSDPVESGLVKSYANPGGRLTGVHSMSSDLTGKRLELLKEIAPKIRRVVTFYDPGNPVAGVSVKSAREAARRLGVEVVEHEIRSVDELRLGLETIKTDEGDSLFIVSDAMVISQAQLVVDAAKRRRLPSMFTDPTPVEKGGLASYGVSYYTIGRLSAKYIQRVLLGTRPADLPVERLDRFELVINARTAREIGLAIPASISLRADRVIE